MTVNSLLVIAPHPDDEINLAGQLIFDYCRRSKEVYIVYTTNGDSTKRIGNSRLIEAVNSCSILGVKRDHILFLGYANEWEGENHLYKFNGALKSKTGKIETNGTGKNKDYAYYKTGKHHEFTYNNFKEDLKSVISDIYADAIICVDYDSHLDHRATSLTFDCVMGELLQENPTYHPIILKKYAYNGVWKGKKDYYLMPMQPTKCDIGFYYGGNEHDLESPNFRWNDRIIWKTPIETKTTLLRNNILYKAARMHKHTIAWYMMQRVINDDLIFWIRSSSNLLNEASLTVSSGNKKYLNDFMMYDSLSIDSTNNKECNLEYAWRPTDKNKKIFITFSEKKTISQINIYEDYVHENHITKLLISYNNKTKECEPNQDGSCTRVILDDNESISELDIQVISFKGKPGITELELLGEKQDNNLKEFTDNSISIEATNNITNHAAVIIERFFLLAEFAVKFKIGYEIKRLFKKY